MNAFENSYLDESYMKNIKALAWASSHNLAIDVLTSFSVIKDVILHDDYISYIVQEDSSERAFLLFSYFEQDEQWNLNPKYASELCEKWRIKGYDTLIMTSEIKVEVCKNNGFYVKNVGKVELLQPLLLGGTHILVRYSDPFWENSMVKLLSAIANKNSTYYKCVFEDSVRIARSTSRSPYEIANDRYDNLQVLAEGIENVKSYFENDGQHKRLAYVKRYNRNFFELEIADEKNIYIIFVNSSNLISQIVEEPIQSMDVVCVEQNPKILEIPKIISVRALDVRTMYAYSVQVKYSDGCVKNYYLKAIDTIDIPNSIEIEGYTFNEDVLKTVGLVDENGELGIKFSNGYYLTADILYYRGISQLVSERIDKVAFENEKIKIEGMYRIPMIIGGIMNRTYRPRKDEFYGVNETVLGEDGNRLSDYSGIAIYLSPDEPYIAETISESSEKIGYIKQDGTWLVPPIFDKGESFDHGHCVKVEKDNHKYLVNEKGEIIPFEYEIDTGKFCSGLCEFSIGKCEQPVSYPFEEYFEDLSPGTWGYVDKYGKIVIEPQYVFTTGFCYDENRAFVAKIVDGKTLWGLIDREGNEIVECKYYELSTHFGKAVSFQREEYGSYGIMDFDGNIIMEPKYSYIYDYFKERGLAAVGNEYDRYGVVRISDGKIIVPFKYDYIDFYDSYIECEEPYGGTTGYDYEGNQLPDNFNFHRWEKGDGYGMWEKDKCGMVDKKGNVIVPFMFYESSHMDYYRNGFVVTGPKKMYGLSTVDGKQILDNKYEGIEMCGDFVKATRKMVGYHWNDDLFLKDGTKIFDEPSRSISVYTNVITRESAYGKEYYRIIKKD